MTSLLESTHLVREWSTPAKKTVEGAPPGPEARPNTVQEELRRQDVKAVSPFYKTGGTGAANGDVRPGQSTTLTMNQKVTSKLGGAADYKVHQTQDHYKLHVIDPKVQSTANMPVSSQTLPSAFRKKPTSGDFPSQHTKRSFLKLAPMEQRRLRSVETRPITTSTYLTESLERHRDMEASRLRDYLKAKEKDANQPWNKPNWPGPKADDPSNNLAELEQIRKQIEGLQKAVNERPEKSFSPRSVVSINGGTKDDSGLLKVRTDLSPESSRLSRTLSRSNAAVQTAHMENIQMAQAPWPYMPAVLVPIGNSPASTMTREFNESYSRKMERYSSLPALDNDDKHSTLIKIQDENRNKPRSIMKRRELETKEQMLYSNGDQQRPGAARHWQEQEVVRAQPSVTETVQKFEESTRTEEVERRVSSKQKEKKHRQADVTRTFSSNSEPARPTGPPKPPVRIYQQRAYTSEDLNLALKQAYETIDEAERIVRNSSRYYSTSRSQQRSNGYLPASENYYRSSATKRIRDHSADDYNYRNGLSHARYGSLSDSLRRGELKYIPNGDIRERHGSSRVHKSISNRDVFHNEMQDDRSYSSFRGGPIVEFPPTLPRGGAPMPPPHRNGFSGSQLSKSRSYADWDDGKGWGSALRRYDDDMTRLESEFHDSLLMPLPNGQNMNEKDYREEKLPGGYESLQREVKSNAGRRLNRDGNPTQFSESKQEFNYKRETESDRRR